MEFRLERNRLASFYDWIKDEVDIRKLAKAGFYYTHTYDITRCFFCKIEVSNWDAEDDPINEHKKWSPRCPLVTNKKSGNVPLGADESSIPAVEIGQDVCGIYKNRHLLICGHTVTCPSCNQM